MSTQQTVFDGQQQFVKISIKDRLRVIVFGLKSKDISVTLTCIFMAYAVTKEKYKFI